jgi:hypothetical protein
MFEMLSTDAGKLVQVVGLIALALLATGWLIGTLITKQP